MHCHIIYNRVVNYCYTCPSLVHKGFIFIMQRVRNINAADVPGKSESSCTGMPDMVQMMS